MKSLPSPSTILFLATLILFPGFFFGLITNVVALAVLVPVVGFFGFNFWVSTQVMEKPCPQCGAIVAGLKNGTPFSCSSCGEPLVVDRSNGSLRFVEQTVFTADEDSDGVEVSPNQTPGKFVDVDVL